MAIIDTITNMSRLWHDLQKTSGYKNNFSYDGAKALMEYLDQLSDDIGEHIEYDPIALCCEYAEYNSLNEYNKIHDTDFNSWDDLAQETTIIEFDNGCAIVQDY